MFKIKIYNQQTERYELIREVSAQSEIKPFLHSLGLSPQWDKDAYRVYYCGLWFGKLVNQRILL